MTSRQSKRGACRLPSSDVPAAVRDVVRSPGVPLPAREGTRFGRDFSRVRVHAGAEAAASARAVHARAFTLGDHIVFGANELAPDTQRGRRLLEHELAHVAEQRDGAPVAIARWPDDDPDKVHRGMKGPERDFEGNPRSEADRERESFHRKYRSGPRLDDQKIILDAVPDLLLSELTSPRTINVKVTDPAIQSIEWYLTAPAGNVVPGSDVVTKPGAPNATSQPFRLDPAMIGTTEGRYHLYCYGSGADGSALAYNVRDFNIVAADLTTGTGRKGSFGTLTWKTYAAHEARGLQSAWVEANLEFLPADSVTCKDVLFVQTGQSYSPGGGRLLAATSKSMDARASGQGWSIDQAEGVDSPYYSVQRDVTSGQLVDRPEQGAIGHGAPNTSAAGLKDRPDAPDDRVVRFETCAVCRTPKPQKVLGCTTWGFYSETSGKPKLMPRTFSDGPSEEFRGAVAGWNRWFNDPARKANQP